MHSPRKARRIKKLQYGLQNMLGFRKKRSRSLQNHGAISSIQNEIDWVSNAFQVAELASAAGGLLPFPYLKGAAELVKTLLKPIQQMQQNQNNFKELTITVTSILQILQEETKNNSETASSLNHFETDCETFYRYLKDISENLGSFNKSSNKLKSLRGFFTADREKDVLMRYQNQIERFRINLMFRGIIRLQRSSDTDEMESHFEKVRYGDLEVLKSTLNGQAEHWEVRWKQEAQTRMVRVYRGQDAISKFKAEREWYSRYRHPYLMQLFGIFTFKESLGLVFHNPWCIPLEDYEKMFAGALRMYVDGYSLGESYHDGFNYVTASISHHATLSWQWHLIIHFKDHEDGYVSYYYVNVLNGRGVIVFDWSPHVLRDIPTRQWFIRTIDDKPQKELARIIDKLCLLEQSNVLFDPLFLWDLYGAVLIRVWQDVPAPAYSVCTGTRGKHLYLVSGNVVEMP